MVASTVAALARWFSAPQVHAHDTTHEPPDGCSPDAWSRAIDGLTPEEAADFRTWVEQYVPATYGRDDDNLYAALIGWREFRRNGGFPS